MDRRESDVTKKEYKEDYRLSTTIACRTFYAILFVLENQQGQKKREAGAHMYKILEETDIRFQNDSDGGGTEE